MTDPNSVNGSVQAANYYFILKTENIQPLLDITNQLTQQIGKNQQIIDKLCLVADHKIKFPETAIDLEKLGLRNTDDAPSEEEEEGTNVRSEEEAQGTSEEESERARKLMDSINEEDEREIEEDNLNSAGVPNNEDPLRYLLAQKYHLDDIQVDNIPDLGKYATNPRIVQLVTDNIKLRRLQKLKKYKNKELLKLVYEYEKFIVVDILPSLRTELLALTNTTTKTMSDDKSLVDYVDFRFSTLNKMYERYSMNVKYLSKLIEMSRALLSYWNNQDEVYERLNHQFVALEFLQLNLTKLLK
ncbi:uncharacterized protein RJT20DRAFT_63961 [Scheffersomyces xylosifermentans]|uniref:uncharacterized protein n=1 Tax=Scheffersomyces xylosifermentans TaxID=1304137 RepID=UPI00315D8CA4